MDFEQYHMMTQRRAQFWGDMAGSKSCLPASLRTGMLICSDSVTGLALVRGKVWRTLLGTKVY